MKKRKLKFGVKKKARKKDGQGCIPGVTVDAKENFTLFGMVFFCVGIFTLIYFQSAKQERRLFASLPHFKLQPLVKNQSLSLSESRFLRKTQVIPEWRNTSFSTLRPGTISFVSSVGLPLIHGKSEYPIGAWMKDPASATDDVYIFEKYLRNNKVKVFRNFSDGVASEVYELPHFWGGTGHVILNGTLYYNRYNSNTIVQYDLRQRMIANSKQLLNAGFANSCPYQWAGSTDIDFAVDRNGLWVIYGDETNQCNIVLSKLHPDTLQVLGTWSTNYSKRSIGNAFVVNGALYALQWYDAIRSKLNLVYNSRSGQVIRTNIPFTISHRFLSMLDYNHKEKRLYGWDKGYLVTYDVKL